MKTPRPTASKIEELPSVKGRLDYFSALNMFTMNVLTRSIGFELGSLALDEAGYSHIGNIAGASPEDLAKIDGITPWKIKRIEGFLKRHNLTFGMDISEWQLARARRRAVEPERPQLSGFQPKRLHLVR